jgi:Tol biopolymer transport system component
MSSTVHRIHIALVAAVVAAGAAVLAAPARSDAPPMGRIVYVSNESGGYHVYTMNIDGSDIRLLTPDAYDELDPAWSPDGTRIAFVRVIGGNRDVWVMNADGSNQVQLTTDAASDRFPSWAPDGSQIAFRSNRRPSHSFDIWRMRADGSGATRVTADGGMWDASAETTPSWSPDGSRLAFVSDRDGNKEIYVSRADGSSPQRFTQNSATDQFPSWSPDASRLAFITDRDGNEEVYTMSGSDGTGEYNVSRNPATERYPGWSPDGSSIVFRSTRDHGFDIYLMRADGTNVVRLTNSLGHQIEPGWQGAGILFGGVAGRVGGIPPIGGAGGGAGSAGRFGVGLTVSAPRRQHVVRQRGVVIYAQCAIVCPVGARGKVKIAGTKRSIALRGVAHDLAAGKRARLKLPLSAHRRRQVARLLSQHRRLRATVAISVRGVSARALRLTVSCRR